MGKRLVSGLGIGSFVYLVSLLLRQQTNVTPKNVLFVFLISIFASVTSGLFESERFSYIVAFLLHYLGMCLFVFVTSYAFFGRTKVVSFFISLTIIYAFSYLVTLIQAKLTARELNQYLKTLENKVPKS